MPKNLTKRSATTIRTAALCVVLALGIGGAELSIDVSSASAVSPSKRPSASTPALKALALVGTNPWAAAQPTDIGRQILALHEHGGRIYMGYGDAGMNTGPVVISSIDPATGAMTADHIADTDAVYVMRSIAGNLVVPSYDPHFTSAYTQGVDWKNDQTIVADHVFDTATLTGDDLWMVGSNGPDAVAWRSLDGGTTWNESLRRSPATAGDVARFYFAGVANGQLTVQAVDERGGPQANSIGFDGSSWASGRPLLRRAGFGWRPLAFGGGFVMAQNGQGLAGPILKYDGRSASAIADGWDYDVKDGVLYVLQADGTVSRSVDGSTWTPIAKAPATARSIVVASGKVWVGTTTSEIWSSTI